MSQLATKQDVLNKFGITKMSQLTSEMAIELFSMVPQMDTELAKEVISQIPAFSDKIKGIFADLEVQVENIVAANKDVNLKYFETSKATIEALKSMSEDEKLTVENKMIIVDKICDIQQDLKVIATQHQQQNKELIEFLTKGISIAILTIGAAFGVRAVVKKK